MLNLRTVHKLVVIIRSWIIDAYMGGGERYIGHFQILSKIRLKTNSRTDRIDSRGRAFISFHFEFRILTALNPGAPCHSLCTDHHRKRAADGLPYICGILPLIAAQRPIDCIPVGRDSTMSCLLSVNMLGGLDCA